MNIFKYCLLYHLKKKRIEGVYTLEVHEDMLMDILLQIYDGNMNHKDTNGHRYIFFSRLILRISFNLKVSRALAIPQRKVKEMDYRQGINEINVG